MAGNPKSTKRRASRAANPKRPNRYLDRMRSELEGMALKRVKEGLEAHGLMHTAPNNWNRDHAISALTVFLSSWSMAMADMREIERRGEFKPTDREREQMIQEMGA